MSFSTNSNGPSAEMNVTPLIDVLLVLLIIFMIITPSTQHGLKSQVPQSDPKAARPNEDSTPLVVELTGTGTELAYRLNQQPVAGVALANTLKGALQSRAERVVFIRAARDLTFAPVAALVATVRAAGATTIALDDPSRPLL